MPIQEVQEKKNEKIQIEPQIEEIIPNKKEIKAQQKQLLKDAKQKEKEEIKLMKAKEKEEEKTRKKREKEEEKTTKI